jgi:hypothetical protein
MTPHPTIDHVVMNLLGYGKCSDAYKILANNCFDFYDIMSFHPWYEQMGVSNSVSIQLLFITDFLNSVIGKISDLTESSILATTQQE